VPATGRRFLGCDIDPGAVSLALERLGAYERGEIDIGRISAAIGDIRVEEGEG
jgi:DNA modification methylase